MKKYFKKIVLFFVAAILFGLNFYTANAAKGQVDEGYYVIESVLDGSKVLDINGASKDNGANLQIWRKNGSPAQTFQIKKAKDGCCTITAVCSGKVLDVAGGKKVAGTNVQQYKSNSSDAQMWKFEHVKDDIFTINSKLGNFCLDVERGKTDNGTNVLIWNKSKDKRNQQFRFKKVNVDKKVSIVIPVYNTERYLSECLESVENQTYKNLEIICVNDGSKDNSLEILKRHAEKDDRIKIINQENAGVSAARNNGIKVATGEYIYFLDSDDILLPHVMETSVNLLERHHADVLAFKYNSFKCDEKIDLSKFNYNDSLVKVCQCKKGDNPFQVFSTNAKIWAKVYRKSFLTKNSIWFDKDIKIGEDILFIFKSRFYTKKMIKDNNIGYLYRVSRPDSAVTESSGNSRRCIENKIKVMRKMISFRNKIGHQSQNIDTYFASYMLRLVFGLGTDIKSVKNQHDKKEFSQLAYREIGKNFVEKYKVKLNADDTEKLKELNRLSK